MVFCLRPFQALGVDFQLAALALQEALAQACGATAHGELDLDRRRRRPIAPRTQVLHTARTMSLKKRRTNRCGDRAFARLVRADEQVDAVCQIRYLRRLAELAKLLNAKTR
ncbi:hypothetical protein AQ715_21510 [Burkholderia pseudomallei]|nr:hypothetical protein AQ715_21510 [Burkholderia pseudomallei]